MHSYFNRSFYLYWTSGASLITSVTFIGVLIQLIAVGILLFEPASVSAIVAVQEFAWLVVGLPLGVCIDRLRRKKKLLSLVGIAQMAIGVAISLLVLSELISFVWLVAISFLVACLGMVFDIGSQKNNPTLRRQVLVLLRRYDTTHVAHGVRHAIRVPFGITLAGAHRAGIYDLRLMRSEGDTYDLKDLRAAIAMGEILRGLSPEHALRPQKHEEAFVITDFGNVCCQDRYGAEPPGTEAKATTVNGIRV